MPGLADPKAIRESKPTLDSPALKFQEHTFYEYSSSDESKTLPVHNPATGAVITTVRVGDSQTAKDAVVKSHAAFQAWRQRPPAERGQLLLKCADLLLAHVDELATLLCLENGKPFIDAKFGDCMHVHNSFRYFGSLIDKLPTQFYDRGPMLAHVVREPHGVCVGILPFNWPPIHTGGKTAPALAMGNSMILKPGEQAPLTVMRIVQLLQQVLPKDLVIAVPGNGPEVPATLIEHPLVKAISFTGSTNAGKIVSQSAAKNLKPCMLELGGKNAFVVFEDADIDRAARDALEGVLFNKGEACTSSSRAIVHESVYDKFVQKLAAAWPKVRVGNGMDSTTHVGPQVSKAQQERILNYLQIAEKEGAKVIAQAPLPKDPALKDGYYTPPTLLGGVRREMRIAQEEVFGPVLTVNAFQTEDEAMDIVNESPYGLICVIYCEKMAKANRVSRRVEAGCVFVNNYRRQLMGLPFGGVKDSGNHREHNIETMEAYSTAKFIQQPSGFGSSGEWRTVADVFDESDGANGILTA